MGNISNNKDDGHLPAITDNGNYIIDIHFDLPINNISSLVYALNNTVGVVEHGIFDKMVDNIIVSNKNGECSVL